MIEPGVGAGNAVFEASVMAHDGTWPALGNDGLADFYRSNPSARVLPLLERLAGADGPVTFPLSTAVALLLEPV